MGISGMVLMIVIGIIILVLRELSEDKVNEIVNAPHNELIFTSILLPLSLHLILSVRFFYFYY